MVLWTVASLAIADFEGALWLAWCCLLLLWCSTEGRSSVLAVGIAVVSASLLCAHAEGRVVFSATRATSDGIVALHGCVMREEAVLAQSPLVCCCVAVAGGSELWAVFFGVLSHVAQSAGSVVSLSGPSVHVLSKAVLAVLYVFHRFSKRAADQIVVCVLLCHL